MSSGHFPLDPAYDPQGGELSEIADRLRSLTHTSYEEGGLRGLASYNDGAEDGASDGRYEAYLSLALELIERCIKRPKTRSPPPPYPGTLSQA